MLVALCTLSEYKFISVLNAKYGHSDLEINEKRKLEKEIKFLQNKPGLPPQLLDLLIQI